MSDLRRDSYGAGYHAGVAHERNGIVEPEHGYPDDPLYLRGVRHGRADYRRRVESLCLSHEIPPTEIPRRIRSDVPPRGGYEL